MHDKPVPQQNDGGQADQSDQDITDACHVKSEPLDVSQTSQWVHVRRGLSAGDAVVSHEPASAHSEMRVKSKSERGHKWKGLLGNKSSAGTARSFG